MGLRRWFSVQQLAVACLVGLIVGFGAYLLTATTSAQPHFPECLFRPEAGFDPWTGQPHGATEDCAQLVGDGSTKVVTQNYPIPADLAARRAIPVPLGFGVGALLVLVASTAAGVWQRRPRSP